MPSGWKEGAPNQVSVANFDISDGKGNSANVSIAPLPPLANRETAIVNMWRQQMGLEEVSSAEAEKALSEVSVAGSKGKLFELAGTANSTDRMQRIITVMQHSPTATWFFKISGDDALVTKEKANFLTFIKSVNLDRLQAPKAASEMSRRETSAPKSSYDWKAPAAWQQVPPGMMQDAKFQVPPQNGATAEVTVSVFDSDTGGDLANVNRWRGQIKLPPVDEAGLGKIVQPLDAKIPGSIVVDMENADQRLIGAVVPRGGSWFFYKLRGGAEAVAAQKNAFIAFSLAEP